MLHGVLVDRDIATGITGRQRAGLDPLRCGLARHDVQHVVGQHQIAAAGSDRGDAHLAGVGVHRLQLRLGVQGDAVAGDHLVQVVGDPGDAEDPRARHHQMHVDVLQHARLPPVVGGEVGDLLARARALHPAGRHGEHRGARTGVADEVPRLRCEIEPVVRRHTTVAQRGFEALVVVPVQLDAGRHHQHVIAVGGTVGACHRVVVRIECADRLANPVGALGHHRGLGSLGTGGLGLAAADQRPQRLVVMLVGRFDHGHVGVALAEHPGGDGDAGGAATDDQDLMFGSGAHFFCYLAVVQAFWTASAQAP